MRAVFAPAAQASGHLTHVIIAVLGSIPGRPRCMMPNARIRPDARRSQCSIREVERTRVLGVVIELRRAGNQLGDLAGNAPDASFDRSRDRKPVEPCRVQARPACSTRRQDCHVEVVVKELEVGRHGVGVR